MNWTKPSTVDSPPVGFKARPEILLHPNIPRPLHGIAPRVIKGLRWWTQQRKAAYAKTGNRCAACGVHKSKARWHKWLEAHEVYEIDFDMGIMEFKEVVALCHSCHNYIHSGRMAALVDQRKLSKEKYHEILLHGEWVLDEKLKRPESFKTVVPWQNWRLKFEGQLYVGPHRTEQDWKKFYV